MLGYEAILSKCSFGKLKQFNRNTTCWLNTIMNAFILSDVMKHITIRILLNPNNSKFIMDDFLTNLCRIDIDISNPYSILNYFKLLDVNGELINREDANEIINIFIKRYMLNIYHKILIKEQPIDCCNTRINLLFVIEVLLRIRNLNKSGYNLENIKKFISLRNIGMDPTIQMIFIMNLLKIINLEITPKDMYTNRFTFVNNIIIEAIIDESITDELSNNVTLYTPANIPGYKVELCIITLIILGRVRALIGFICNNICFIYDPFTEKIIEYDWINIHTYIYSYVYVKESYIEELFSKKE